MPLVGVLLLLLAGGPAAATAALVADARLVPGGLEVAVTNAGPDAAPGVAPEVVYQHRTLAGAPAALAPGTRHTWEIPLPPPARPGAATAVVRVRAAGAAARPAPPVVVALVATPGTPPADVRVALRTEPVARAGAATARLANPGSRAVDGRLVVILPDGLVTDPQARPASVPAGADAALAFVIENRGGVPPGTYPAYAVFEYADAEGQQAALARDVVHVTEAATRGAVPLVVGALALFAALAALAVALRRSAGRRRPAARAAAGAVLVGLAAAAPAGAQAPAHRWDAEGDVAGVTDIVDPTTGAPLGVVEYWQTRRGDRLTALRIARFRDGSSDEDFAEARVADGLEALRGRSVVRDADGAAVAEVHIDVPGQRIRGAWGRGDARREIDEPAPLPPQTYWGPLVFLLLKRAAGAGEERVAFRTVALTPRPRVFDLEILRGEVDTLERAGLPLDTVRFTLAPTIHWAIDPIIQAFVPSSTFWIHPGDPPALVRYEGPRNYARRAIRIE